MNLQNQHEWKPGGRHWMSITRAEYDAISSELERLQAALRDDIETLGTIADRLALGSRDRNTFEEIVARNRALLDDIQ